MSVNTAGSKQHKPPGPRDFLGLRTVDAMKRNPLQLMLDLHETYGEIVHHTLLNAPVYFFTHPDHVSHILQDNHRNYQRGRDYRRLRRLLGNGLVTNDGASWLKQRRLMQPAFHRRRIAGFGETMAQETQQMLAQWEAPASAGEPLDVSSEMMRVTLNIVSRVMFGAAVQDDAARIEPLVTMAQREVRNRLYALVDVPEWIPLPGNRRSRNARETIDKVVTRIIAARRQSDTPQEDDLLAMLLEARDPDTGEPMDDDQLRDEVRTIFLAGHETTANALTWTWYLLAQNPDAAGKLREELARVLSGRLPTVADVPQLPYTKMVVEESMRLLPPVWSISREAIADDEIGGYRIPAGGTVIMSQYITHRHGDFWDDPDDFRPERFAPELAKERHRFAYFPFGGGPRLCIGNNFAMLEAQLLLAAIAQRYELDLVPDHPVDLEPLITLRPRHGMMMTLRPCA